MRGGEASPDLDAHEQEPRYARSVRRRREAKRREVLQERLCYHRAQIARHTRTLEQLVEVHRRQAEACEVALRSPDEAGVNCAEA